MAGESVSFSDVDVSIPGQSGTAPTRSVYGWILIHKHDIQEIFDWNLNWASYRDGFGDRHFNFWFGLEKVHRLTDAQPYRLRVEMRDIDSGDWFSVQYSYFHVGPESDGYRLDVSGYNGDAVNALQYEGNLLDGMKFSTNDRDYDLASFYDCASEYKGGWWYNDCREANLCCEHEHWWHGHYLDYSLMLIKPQS